MLNYVLCDTQIDHVYGPKFIIFMLCIYNNEPFKTIENDTFQIQSSQNQEKK